MSINRILLNEDERINYPTYHFGDDFPFKIEPTILESGTNGGWNIFMPQPLTLLVRQTS